MLMTISLVYMVVNQRPLASSIFVVLLSMSSCPHSTSQFVYAVQPRQQKVGENSKGKVQNFIFSKESCVTEATKKLSNVTFALVTCASHAA